MRGLEQIKDDVLRGNFKISKEKELILSDIYAQITKISTGKPKLLKFGCTSCLVTAYKVISNYLKHHYEESFDDSNNSTAKVKIKKVKK